VFLSTKNTEYFSLFLKDTIFNKQCWENWTATCKRLKLDPYLSKVNSKWIKDLDVGPETLKRLQESIRKILKDIRIGNALLNKTPIAQKNRNEN
jgi:hypothetical protein